VPDSDSQGAISLEDFGIEGGDGYSSSNAVAGVARVVRTEFVTPRVRRITATSDELAKLPPDLGWNRPFRAYFSKPGFYDKVYVPDIESNGLFGDTFALDQEYAVVRAYTIRRLDRRARELDVDFVLHEHGISSKWAASAEEGSGFGFLISKLEMFAPPLPDVDCMLLFGDETAIPHIANTLGALDEGCRAIVLIEVADKDEEQRLDTGPNVSVQWVHRDGAPPGRSGKLEEAVRSLPWPEGRVHVFVAAETKVVGAIRRFIRQEHELVRKMFTDPEVDASTYEVAAYWRLGLTTDEDVRLRAGRTMQRVAEGASVLDILEEDLDAD